MAYKHGVYGSEVETSLVPMVSVNAGVPVVFGTAPVHLAKGSDVVNKPILCYTYAEAVKALGYSDDWEAYTLCEMMESHFSLFNVAPVIFVNVLDPATHKETVTSQELDVIDNTVKTTAPVVLSSLVVKNVSAEATTYILDTDYTAAFNDDGELVISIIEGGQAEGQIKLALTYDKLKPESVDADDIIGGVSLVDGSLKGLELIDQVYSMFNIIPGIILCPGFSHLPAVAAVMKAKCTGISGHFEAIAIADADMATCTKYSDVPNWKSTNNYVDPRLALCWAEVALGGKRYHLSTQMAGVICATDAKHDDIPFWSPSNQSLQCDSAIANDEELFLDSQTAAYLNGNGIVTALNFGSNGWRLWGNRTTAYPSNTDVKDAFLCIRRMFNWVNNTLITTFWNKIDNPLNKRLIQTIVDSANVWLNGLTSREIILGGRVEFRKEDNTTTELMDGIIRFHVFITPPSPAREIEFIQEYDPNYVDGLFD